MMTDEQAIELMAKTIFQHWQFKAPVDWIDGGNSNKQLEARSYAFAVFTALKSAGFQHVPVGSVVRPREATAAMIKAGTEVAAVVEKLLDDGKVLLRYTVNEEQAAGIYRAMIEAAKGGG